MAGAHRRFRPKLKYRVVGLGLVVLLAGSSLTDASSSWAHGDGSEHGKPGERELRRVETRLLGAGHAAEHASVRRAERLARARWLRLSPARRRAVMERRQRARRQVMARAAAAGDPATDGRWSGQVPIPTMGIHAAVLPTGKVMWFSRADADSSENEAVAYLWDPRKPLGDPTALRRVDPPVNPETGRPVNLFCAGQSLLADGQLLVTGGNLAYESATSDYKGLNRIYTFDPWSEEWTEQPRMAHGRWYPTQTLLPDGRTLIVSGREETGDHNNRDIEVFTPPAARGGRGSVAKVGAYGDASLPGSPAGPEYYPHWFVMPNGNVLNAGPTTEESWILRLMGGGLTSEDRPPWQRQRFYGTGVLMPGGPEGSTRVARIGGFGWYPKAGGAPSPAEQREASSTTEVFDEARPTTRSVRGPSMAQARAHHNTVLLPDGSMVSVGGGYGNRDDDLRASGPEHKAIEIWDPKTDSWRLGPAQAYKRAYHSTALLLPDGRVVSAGDDRDPTKDPERRTDVAEIYEPAYLSIPGPRPAITSAPAAVNWNQPFAVQTSSPITRAVLVAPGATTHANDMQQRHVELRITPSSSGASLVAPPNANVAPPGWYMLFALSEDGEPSVAKWIRLGAGTTPPPLPSTPTPSPAPISTPTPSPSPTPPPPSVTGQAPDTTAPGLSMTLKASYRLQPVLRDGLLVPLACTEACELTVRLRLRPAVAARLEPAAARRPMVAGRATRRLSGPGAARVRVKLSAKARRALRPLRRVRLTVQATATDVAGNVRKVERQVTLKRARR